MEGGNNSDGSRDGVGAPKKPIFLSNNFDEYRRMRAEAAIKRRHEQAKEQNASDDGWNHFTGPLRPTRPSLDEIGQADQSGRTGRAKSSFSDLERSQTVDRFGSIFMERIGAAMSSGKLSRAWQDSDGGSSTEDYSAERRLIEPHLTPVIWGSSCVVITLLSLRLGRWYQGRNAVSAGISRPTQRSVASNRTSNSNIKSLQDARHARQQQSPFNPREEMANELQSNLVTLPVDASISLLVGISTTLFLTRPHYLMNDVAKAPLMSGRSALAEELCLPFREEMRVVNEQFHTYTPKHDNATGDGGVEERRVAIPYSDIWEEENVGKFDSLRAVRDFVTNCQKRQRVAKQIVEDDGRELSEQELLDVPIPAPGISSDTDDAERDEFSIE
ncbi:hypothetical protein ACHAXT_002757 [Thalassiosira profunda]